MKVLIETDQKYVMEIIETIIRELDCNRFALNKDGNDIVFDMRDRYSEKGKKLSHDESIILHDGKLEIVKNEKAVHNS